MLLKRCKDAILMLESQLKKDLGDERSFLQGEASAAALAPQSSSQAVAQPAPAAASEPALPQRQSNGGA